MLPRLQVLLAFFAREVMSLPESPYPGFLLTETYPKTHLGCCLLTPDCRPSPSPLTPTQPIPKSLGGLDATRAPTLRMQLASDLASPDYQSCEPGPATFLSGSPHPPSVQWRSFHPLLPMEAIGYIEREQQTVPLKPIGLVMPWSSCIHLVKER